jgi:dihydrofolate reductase
MKNISMIAAIGKNNELGKDNDLIWHIKEDLQFFKEKTMHKPIVMGYKTLESLPKLLPGRKHIVLTRRDLKLDPEIIILHSKEELLEYAITHQEELMIIGGASIYNQMIDDADTMYLTEIDAEADADCYFPEIKENEWEKEVLCEHNDHIPKYKHLIYKRIN